MSAQRWRAKLIPRSTPRGMVVESNPEPIYGDVMTRKGFDTWKRHEDDAEIARLGAPACLRTLVPVDENGVEIPKFSPAWLKAMFADDDT